VDFSPEMLDNLYQWWYASGNFDRWTYAFDEFMAE
jgi:hypothetical protein